MNQKKQPHTEYCCEQRISGDKGNENGEYSADQIAVIQTPIQRPILDKNNWCQNRGQYGGG